MKTKAQNLWQKLLATYWFVPSLMAVGAVVLALGVVVLDRQFGPQLIGSISWFYLSQAEGVRELLSTVAGSMITVTGVVFSIMVVALSLASQQFGPRLLSNFMRDRGNQLVFGTIIATYIYCLLVLRSTGAGNGFIPHLSEVVGLMLALASLGALIYFIHHTAESIQAGKVIDRVSEELEKAIDRLFPAEGSARPAPLPEEFPHSDRKGFQVRAHRKGYLQAVALEGLLRLAVQTEILVRVECKPGHFMVPGAALLSVWPWEAENQELQRRLQNCFIIGRQRTPEQDVEFLIDELVEMAVRSLSPGINDPFTAMACLDHLSAALARVAGRGLPATYHFDDRKRLRVITWSTTYRNLVEAALDQIRQNAAEHTAVYLRLLEVIGRVAALCTKEEQYQPLLDQARLVLDAAWRHVASAADRQEVEERFQRLAELAKHRFGLDLPLGG